MLVAGHHTEWRGGGGGIAPIQGSAANAPVTDPAGCVCAHGRARDSAGGAYGPHAERAAHRECTARARIRRAPLGE